MRPSDGLQGRVMRSRIAGLQSTVGELFFTIKFKLFFPIPKYFPVLIHSLDLVAVLKVACLKISRCVCDKKTSGMGSAPITSF